MVVPEAARSGRVEGTTFAGAGAGDWARVMGRLKDEVGETAYRSWLRSMRLDRIENGEGVIAVPTRFLRNWVATHYADRLLALWRTENEAVTRLSIIVEPQVAARAAAEEEPAAAQPAFAEPAGPPDIAEDRGYLSAPPSSFDRMGGFCSQRLAGFCSCSCFVANRSHSGRPRQRQNLFPSEASFRLFALHYCSL